MSGAQDQCSKVAYPSPAAARRAHRRAGFRIVAYQCPECRRWHVTNAEKNGGRR